MNDLTTFKSIELINKKSLKLICTPQAILNKSQSNSTHPTLQYEQSIRAQPETVSNKKLQFLLFNECFCCDPRAGAGWWYTRLTNTCIQWVGEIRHLFTLAVDKTHTFLQQLYTDGHKHTLTDTHTHPHTILYCDVLVLTQTQSHLKRRKNTYTHRHTCRNTH
jgi:hypothetical protein